MSRTDAHAPFHVRLVRGDIPRVEVHDHADGVCDLPTPYSLAALGHRGGHCHWDWLWDGRGLCSCEMCHCGDLHRRERPADRQQTRRELRDAVLRWKTTGEL